MKVETSVHPIFCNNIINMTIFLFLQTKPDSQGEGIMFSLMKRSKWETVQSEEVTRFLMAISVKLECWGCGLIWSSTLSLPANSDSLGGGVTLLSAREGEIEQDVYFGTE